MHVHNHTQLLMVMNTEPDSVTEQYLYLRGDYHSHHRDQGSVPFSRMTEQTIRPFVPLSQICMSGPVCAGSPRGCVNTY